MSSAPDVASVQDVISVPEAAPVVDIASSPNGTSIPNGTSVPNGHSVTNGTTNGITNGTTNGITNEVTNGTTHGTTVLNGTSSASPIPDGISAVASVSDDPVTFPVPDGTSTSASGPTSLKLAIIGGGIGGIALALGLLNHPQVDFQIYEAAPIWVQIGAGLGLGPNAQSALESLGPEAEAAFRKNVTGNMWETHQKTFLNFFAVSSMVPLMALAFLFYSSQQVFTSPLCNIGSWRQSRPAYSYPKMLYGFTILPSCPFRQRPYCVGTQGSRPHEQTSSIY